MRIRIVPILGMALLLACGTRGVDRRGKPMTLRVVTFNIHDMYVGSSNRPERMRAIAGKLCELDPDLAGFQEAFVKKDRKLLLEQLRKGSRLRYHRYYPSGVVGSGLLVVSAFPIAECDFFRFSESNPFYEIKEGDWWAGKGVALARIELSPGVLLDFYNTHAQASYGKPAYQAIRKRQMAEAAGFVNRTRSGNGPLLLLVGDLNCWVGQVDFNALAQGANLRRAMKIPSRIDHIFAANDPRWLVEVLETVEIKGEVLALSDHSGFMATLRLVPRPRNR